MSALDLFLGFILTTMLFHLRPSPSGSAWDLVCFVGAIIGIGICLYRLGAVAFPALFRKG